MPAEPTVTDGSGVHSGAGSGAAPSEELMGAINGLARLFGSRQAQTRLSDAAGAAVSQQGVQILRAVHRQGGQPIAELAAAARMDVSAVSRQLRVLESDGLVARTGDATDARVTRISLTPAGRRVAQRLIEVQRRHLNDALSGWDESERTALAALLNRLLHDMRSTEFKPIGS